MSFATPLLRDILPGVSRSFALSLQIVPASLRAPFGITYLVARAADTIADTRALPPVERQRQVEALRAAIRPDATADPGELATRVVAGHPGAERVLLARLPEVLAAYRALAPEDRARCQAVLLTLTQAMLDALAYFPAEGDGRIRALETRTDLDRYTYVNAGCVGEFWTDLTAAHRRRCARGDVGLQRARAARFGQGLQLTNVLRDLPRDLRLGRCYLPRTDLAPLGLGPPDLLDPGALGRLRPLLGTLTDRARAHLDEGLAYVLALPRAEVRLRLAAVWPLLIGLGTLARLGRAENPLDPTVTVKISRRELRRHLAASVALVASNRGLAAYTRRLAATVSAG